MRSTAATHLSTLFGEDGFGEDDVLRRGRSGRTVGPMSEIKDNREAGRYELDVGGQIAFALYRRDGSTLYIRHVEAPVPLRGTGAAGRLMEGIMAIARGERLTVVPLCSYAAAWIRRHQARD